MIAILSESEYRELSRADKELQQLKKQIEGCVTNPVDVIYHDAPVDFNIQKSIKPIVRCYYRLLKKAPESPLWRYPGPCLFFAYTFNFHPTTI